MALQVFTIEHPPESWLIKEAKAYTGGGLTRVSKMPCKCYNLPARECKVGSALRKAGQKERAATGRTDIVCGWCYALKGQFVFQKSIDAAYRRLATIYQPHWVEAMATLIARQSPGYFRWHAAGDFQSMTHLRNVVLVAKLTPDTLHWAPTQEHKLVADYAKVYGPFPKNLVVRRSSPLVDHPLSPASYWPTSYAARTPSEDPSVHNCPAQSQGNHCGACRACWHYDVPTIAYHLH